VLLQDEILALAWHRNVGRGGWAGPIDFFHDQGAIVAQHVRYCSMLNGPLILLARHDDEMAGRGGRLGSALLYGLPGNVYFCERNEDKVS